MALFWVLHLGVFRSAQVAPVGILARHYDINIYSNSSEFKGKLEIGNNSAADFDTKFINIAELFTKSDSTQRFL